MRTTRQKLDQRFRELVSARSMFEANWRTITDQILPYRARWGRKGKRHWSTSKDKLLINSTPTKALRVLAAGLMAGVTSPARVWFRLTTSNKQLNELHSVKTYLDQVERIIREALAQGDFYQTLASGIYRDLALVATAAAWVDARPEGGVRFESMPIGEFYIDVNSDGVVDTVFRERPMSVRQVVERYGLENVSEQTRSLHEQGQLGVDVKVIQAVFPNDDWKPARADIEGKRWLSYHYEPAARDGKFLRVGGYEEFPVVAPRWNVLSGEAYGRGSPGWESVGDCQMLQHYEVRLARLIDKSADPPMRASQALRGARASLVSGDITYTPDTGQHAFEPVQEIPPQAVEKVMLAIQRCEERIDEAFYVDLWLAMLNDDRAQRPTATEVEHRRTEIMLQLGPLLENLNEDLLEPAITRTFAILERQGAMPDPPPEMLESDGGQEIRVEFISVMHQAQKLTGISGVRELVTQVQRLAQAGVPVTDKLDGDAIVDELADMLGVRPDLVRADDEVEEMRRALAEKQEAQDAGQAALAAAEGAKNLSAVDPEKLKELALSVSPAAGAQAGLQ